MGKGRNRNKEKDAYNGPTQKGRKDEDEMSDSDESVSTHLTFDDDMRSVQGDVEDLDSTVFLDSLEGHIDNAAHKNVNIRMAALRHLQLALTSQYIPELVIKWKATIMDIIIKNLRKTDDEIAICAVLLALVSVQVGTEISEDVEDHLSILRQLVVDPAKSDHIRGICALSLSLTSHLSSENDDNIALSVKSLRQSWTSVKVNSPGTRLFTMCLSSWALILLSADGATLNSAIADEPKLTTFLEADQLDIRISAGEILAFLCQLLGGVRPGFRFPNHNHILNILETILADNSKNKAKRDKRVQRFSFREIYACIAADETPTVTIKFSRESLILESCASKLLYDQCCELLRGGMMRQLQQNELLRDLFDLGAVPTGPSEKINKMERLAIHDAATKYRNQVRGKQRDKRSAACW